QAEALAVEARLVGLQHKAAVGQRVAVAEVDDHVFGLRGPAAAEHRLDAAADRIAAADLAAADGRAAAGQRLVEVNRRVAAGEIGQVRTDRETNATAGGAEPRSVMLVGNGRGVPVGRAPPRVEVADVAFKADENRA